MPWPVVAVACCWMVGFGQVPSSAVTGQQQSLHALPLCGHARFVDQPGHG
jgi:hypothetical protein